jgi:hypothetical protein
MKNMVFKNMKGDLEMENVMVLVSYIQEQNQSNILMEYLNNYIFVLKIKMY